MTVIPMKQITGRHVLFMMIGFFCVMLVANGIFVYLALSTFRGLENPNAYQDGVNYNQRIEAAQKQAALGWSHQLVLTSGGALELKLVNSDASPVTGVTVSGEVRRPVGGDKSHSLHFEEMGKGIYRADIGQNIIGNWIVSLEATRSQSAIYRIKERLWLKPNS